MQSWCDRSFPRAGQPPQIRHWSQHRAAWAAARGQTEREPQDHPSHHLDMYPAGHGVGFRDFNVHAATDPADHAAFMRSPQ